MTLSLPPGTRRGDEYFCPCPNPLCPKPSKFQYNTRKNVGQCFACGHTIGSLAEAIRAFGSSSEAVHVRRPRQARYTAEEPLIPVSSAPLRVRVYLTGRRVNPEQWGGIMYGPQSDMLYFPIDSCDKRHKPSYQRRSIDRKGWLSPPDKQHYMFNLERWKAVNIKSIILVEGPFDVLSPASLCPAWGTIAVSLLGSEMYHAQCAALLSAGVQKALIWLDPDEAGDKGRRQVWGMLSAWGVPNVRWFCEDTYTHMRYPTEPGDVKDATVIERAVKEALYDY